MNIIRIATNNEVSIHEFPKGTYSERDREFCRLIGSECSFYETVSPRRLYTELGASNRLGERALMIVDEEGMYHSFGINPVASYLYETDLHGIPIKGNVLIVGERWTEGVAELSGLSEAQFQNLYSQLENLASQIKGRY